MGEFWARFREWSAFGAPVPLVLEDGTAVTQFYVPYLSGLQLYKATAGGRGDAGDEGGLDRARKGGSEDSSGGEDSSGVEGPSSAAPAVLGPGVAVPGQESLLFEYLEATSPAGRAPLSDKVAELAEGVCPDLLEVRSSELHPASWLAIAWYPLYCIPGGRPVKDLNACFLTFHSFSGLLPARGCTLQAGPSEEELAQAAARGMPKGGGLALYPFAYAAYKVNGGVWTDGAVGEKHLALMSDTAAWWLVRHGATMPDLEFFRQKGHPAQAGGGSDARHSVRKRG